MMRRRLGGCLVASLVLGVSAALADVCGKPSEDVWEGPCKGGVPEGEGKYQSANGVRRDEEERHKMTGMCRRRTRGR